MTSGNSPSSESRRERSPQPHRASPATSIVRSALRRTILYYKGTAKRMSVQYCSHVRLISLMSVVDWKTSVSKLRVSSLKPSANWERTWRQIENQQRATRGHSQNAGGRMDMAAFRCGVAGADDRKRAIGLRAARGAEARKVRSIPMQLRHFYFG